MKIERLRRRLLEDHLEDATDEQPAPDREDLEDED